MNQRYTIGWDVGGAHLKAVLLDANHQLLQVLQVPCALWRGLNELEAAIDNVLQPFGLLGVSAKSIELLHAITMTGELVDLFNNRQAGVNKISRVMHSKLVGTKLFYAGALQADFAGFVRIETVQAHWQQIASANWLASAAFVAQYVANGLLVDIGSTTSDFVLIEQQQPRCLGLTDAARMQTEALVYTGVVRTPLMAFSQKVMFNDNLTAVAAEYFATAADVYRLTGDLAAHNDMADTADGQAKTKLASAQRIARMIGHDAQDAPLESWLALAQTFKQQQLARLQEVATKHLALLNPNTQRYIVGAGAGSFLAREIANNLQLPYVEAADFVSLVDNNSENIALNHSMGVCLPAYAVAYLAT